MSGFLSIPSSSQGPSFYWPPESPSTNILGVSNYGQATGPYPRLTLLVLLSGSWDYTGDQHANGSHSPVTSAPGSPENGSSFAVSHAHHFRRPIRSGALGPEPAQRVGFSRRLSERSTKPRVGDLSRVSALILQTRASPHLCY